MKPDNVFLNAALAAVVAAVTATGMSYLFLRYAPMEPQSADPERIERIIRDYLINKPWSRRRMSTITGRPPSSRYSSKKQSRKMPMRSSGRRFPMWLATPMAT